MNKGGNLGQKKDYDDIMKQINLIAEKFSKLYPIGCTIVLLSGNPLNKTIAEIIASKSKDSKIIIGLITKLTTEEVNETILMPNSQFKQYYGERFEEAYDKICQYFKKMDDIRGGYFTYHFIKDNEMRGVLNNTMKIDKDKYSLYVDDINGEDILLIDDSITKGQSIKSAVEVISDCYLPKSISVLTLMSKLY